MLSANGRFAIVYNGEVYNFPDLRRDLASKGHTFRGNSDTEVILAAIEEWGLKLALSKFVGMFAFALWDRSSRQLHLVRDRLGIKPLYYGWCDQSFLFGSELRAIEQHPDFVGEVDRGALSLYLRFSYVPAPWSMFKGIRKLLPGTILTANGVKGEETTEAYWSLHDVAERGMRHSFQGEEKEAITKLEGLLREASADISEHFWPITELYKSTHSAIVLSLQRFSLRISCLIWEHPWNSKNNPRS